MGDVVGSQNVRKDRFLPVWEHSDNYRNKIPFPAPPGNGNWSEHISFVSSESPSQLVRWPQPTVLCLHCRLTASSAILGTTPATVSHLWRCKRRLCHDTLTPLTPIQPDGPRRTIVLAGD